MSVVSESNSDKSKSSKSLHASIGEADVEDVKKKSTQSLKGNSKLNASVKNSTHEAAHQIVKVSMKVDEKIPSKFEHLQETLHETQADEHIENEEEEEDEEDNEYNNEDEMEIEDNEQEEEVEEVIKKPEQPSFICHELNPGGKRNTINLKLKGPQSEADSEDDILYPRPKVGHRYLMINPADTNTRAAALAKITGDTYVDKLMEQINFKIEKYECPKINQDKCKLSQGAIGTANNAFKEFKLSDNIANKGPYLEPMVKMIKRLKIYKRALSTMVIYFRAYSPILFNIKKSYDDLVNFRISQFRQSQHEKVTIYHDMALVFTKLHEYQFPEQEKLLKGQKYLNLLLVRIQKQDEAIKCITEILSKMERALGEHYEVERDLEDQIKMLNHESTERIEKMNLPMKKFEIVPEDNENKAVKSELNGTVGDGLNDEEEEDINLDEKMDEDKRMVLILAYAVCLKDLEDAQKKLRVYENKYQNVSPRHELESTKKKILEEKAQVKTLIEEKDEFDQKLITLKEEELLIVKELEDFRAMPEEVRLEAVKAKFVKEKAQQDHSSLENEENSKTDILTDEEGDDDFEEDAIENQSDIDF